MGKGKNRKKLADLIPSEHINFYLAFYDLIQKIDLKSLPESSQDLSVLKRGYTVFS